MTESEGQPTVRTPQKGKAPQETVSDSAASAQARLHAAYQAYVSVVRDARKGFEEPYDTFLAARQEVWKQLENAWGEYGQSSQDAAGQADAQERLDEAGKTYTQAVQRAARDCEQLYRNYVRAIQKAWAQIDASVMDTGLLAAIGQSEMTVAQLAAADANALYAPSPDQ